MTRNGLSSSTKVSATAVTKLVIARGGALLSWIEGLPVSNRLRLAHPGTAATKNAAAATNEAAVEGVRRGILSVLKAWRKRCSSCGRSRLGTLAQRQDRQTMTELRSACCDGENLRLSLLVAEGGSCEGRDSEETRLSFTRKETTSTRA